MLPTIDTGNLRLRLNRKILDVALLRLRFCSIGPAKSGTVNRREYADKSGRNLAKIISGQALIAPALDFPAGYVYLLQTYRTTSVEATVSKEE
ncbi:MAG: hypothetical protein ACYDBT_10410 [Desulfobulbaceae bacterium]